MAYKGKEQDEDNPYADLQKVTVLNDSKIFNDNPLKPRECCEVITQILYLLHQGETLTTDEATSLFFGITKLFQSKDPQLRRLIYLGIKELAEAEDQSFIVIASLEKDINSNIDLFRANAIRVLSKILDANMVEQRERYLRQAIVSKDCLVQSSALTAGIRLYEKSPDVIRRWVNEVQEAIKSDDDMVSFHALQLLYMIKAHDRRAIAKVLISLSKRPPSSPFAMCLLIRYTFKMLNSIEDKLPQELVECLNRALHHKSTQVQLEAAKALCNLQNGSETIVAPAVETLTDMLNSHLPVERFAAVRVLNSIVDGYPVLVGSRAEVELEHLVQDSNRNIAVLAMTTMLKTGVETSIDRLFQTMEKFMHNIPDDLKVALVNAIQSLCLKFPNKYESLMSFLSKALREEGGFEYKKSIVESILILMNEIKKSRPIGLEHLCEFIEDCEYSGLVIRVLHVLGDIGPSLDQPARFIRFIFNRVLLELPQVRAVAVSALQKFGENCPTLREDILVLLERCLLDDDDIVRDRATTGISFLRQEEKLSLSFDAEWNSLDLEAALNKYMEGGDFGETFNEAMIEKIPEKVVKKPEMGGVQGHGISPPTEKKKPKVKNIAEILGKIPGYKQMGPIFQTTKATSLTEDDSEYQVDLIKHIFANHVIFQFIVMNTIEDVYLCNATVELEFDEDLFEVESTTPAQVCEKDEINHIFVACKFDQDELQQQILEEGLEMSAVMKFINKEGVEDPEELEYEQGYEDEYELNAVEFELKDFIKGVDDLNKPQFKVAYTSFPKANQTKKKFTLSMPNLQTAVDAVVEKLGLAGVEFSDRVPDEAKSCMVDLAGKHINGSQILARALFKQGRERTAMQIGVTSDDPDLSGALVSSIK